MPQTQTDLLRELTDVAETFSSLSEKLSEVALELRAPGLPPSETLLQELADSRGHFEDLRGRVVELAGLPEPPQDINSLQDLEALLQSLAEEELKAQALSILDRILSIVHRAAGEFQPLTDCQDKAWELREAVAALSSPNSHPEAPALAHHRHPFVEFLLLVEQHDELDDEVWLTLRKSVSDSFGKKLSLAAARGKLIVSQTSSPTESPNVTDPPNEEVPVMSGAGEEPGPNGEQESGTTEGATRKQRSKAQR